MAHDHDHGTLNYNRAFALGVVLNVTYVAVEAGYGLWTSSMSLLADAGHNLSDVLSLLLAWGAHHLAHRPPTRNYTYGLRGSTILAALFNAILLLGAVGAIVWESIRRLVDPPAVLPSVIIFVAGIGVLVNLGTTLLFLKGRKEDLNVRGAYLHMAADTAVSAGVVVGGLLIMATGSRWIDPALGLLIAAVIFIGTWGLLRQSIKLAIHAVPEHIDMDAVADYLRGRPGVTQVHDLHVWGMSTTESALTVHLVLPDPPDDPDAFLVETCEGLRERFGIGHATIQIERELHEEFCPQARGCAV
jgi:cobalt-zinc-cadmium efflux system protein